MRAVLINKTGNLENLSALLSLRQVEQPEISGDEILFEVIACGVCHTELDEISGRAAPSFLPIIPGHQIVGRVVQIGPECKSFKPDELAAVGWIYSTCRKCNFCMRKKENLCPEFKATGKDIHGGYAEYFKISSRFALKIDRATNFSPFQIAPLLCAGAIGYRSLQLSRPEDGMNIGLFGFGASNHLVLKTIHAILPASRVFVFSRSATERELAEELGATWTGDISESAPQPLDRAIDTTPAWTPVLSALNNLRPDGRLIINAIRKEERFQQELLSLNYEKHLWKEKSIQSVANITRTNIEEFLKLAFRFDIRPEIELFPLKDAPLALQQIFQREIRGAKVLIVKD